MSNECINLPINKSNFTGWTGVNVPGEIEKRSGTWVTKAGARYFHNGFKYNPEMSRHWEWGTVVEGEFEFEYGDEVFRVQEGFSYIMAPDVVLNARPVKKPFLVWVEMDGPVTSVIMEECGGRLEKVTIRKHCSEQVNCIVRIANLLHEHPYGYQLFVHSNLWKYIANTINPANSFEKGISPNIQSTIDLLHRKNFSQKYSLLELSRISGLSVETFRKKFLKEIGEPPIKYVLKCKIRRAKELLSNRELTIQQVSQETGFDNQYYFSRVFKKYEGMWPTDYRKRFYP
jgi:AraC-like DNA-binding protein